MLRARLTSLASKDVHDAVNGYEQQRSGLGTRFFDKLEEVLVAIEDRPHYFPYAFMDMRRARLSPFPYGVFFIEQPGFLEVVAVTHLHRHPSSWQSRR